MKRIFKFLKWTIIIFCGLIFVAILFLRFSRFSDELIYQMNDTNYNKFISELNYEEYFIEVEKGIKLHGVLFKPDSIEIKGTIFHYSGKGMHLMTSLQETYKPLLENGFQVFCYERRNFGMSNGEAENSLTLKKDALKIFDEITNKEVVRNKPIILWGQSLGGIFATMNAKERQDKVSGLVLEGTFSSFPDVGKVYARVLNLENYKWIVPVLMNNDFPTDANIKELTIPTVIIHSKSDKQIPYELGRKIYNSSNKNNTEFWDVESKHIMTIYDYEEEYVKKFKAMI